MGGVHPPNRKSQLAFLGSSRSIKVGFCHRAAILRIGGEDEMKPTFRGVDGVRRHLETQITRCNDQIARARKVLAKKVRGNVRQATTRIEVYTERRRAYRDALKALGEISPGASGPGDVGSIQLAKDQVARVESALKLIYETTQHGGHDISDGRDWATVEGEAEIALTIVTETGKGGS